MGKKSENASEVFNLFSFFAFILDIFKGIFSFIAAFFSLFFS